MAEKYADTPILRQIIQETMQRCRVLQMSIVCAKKKY